jgi:hypothetical protein
MAHIELEANTPASGFVSIGSRIPLGCVVGVDELLGKHSDVLIASSSVIVDLAVTLHAAGAFDA